MCQKKFGIVANYLTRKDLKKNHVDVLPSSFGPKDAICVPCYEEQVVENSDKVIQWSRENMNKEEFDNLFKTDPLQIRVMEKYLNDHPIDEVAPPQTSAPSSPMGGSLPQTSPKTVQGSLPASTPKNVNLAGFTSTSQLKQLTQTLHDQTKAQWDKNGVVQYKDEALAILQRMWGQQVQFIVACSQLSKEGYRLMAIDEGKEGSSGGIAGGVNAYFYFQKMDFVR